MAMTWDGLGIQLLTAKGAKIASVMLFDNGWVAVGADGSVDGTPEALASLQWKVGDEAKPMDALLSKKQKKGLLSGK